MQSCDNTREAQPDRRTAAPRSARMSQGSPGKATQTCARALSRVDGSSRRETPVRSFDIVPHVKRVLMIAGTG